MAQESQDWKNLNPMFYWKYVMAKGKRTHPKILFLDCAPSVSTLTDMATKFPEIDFVIESENPPGGIGVYSQNVTYRWRKSMEYWHWLESLTTIDYVVVNEKDKEMWIQVGLCGVKVLFNIDELLSEIDNLTVLSNVQRVENWEFCKSLLT